MGEVSCLIRRTLPALLAAAILMMSAGAHAATSAKNEGAGPGTGKGPEQRVIVKLRETGPVQATAENRSARARQVLAQVSARLGRELKPLRTLGTGATLAEVPEGMTAEEAVASLAQEADVEYAEPDLLMQPMMSPNDTRYYEQWQYFDATGGMNLPAAWDSAQGAGVTVAVLDTGYRPHADLAANIVAGYDMISSAFIANDGNGRDNDPRDPGDWANAGECGNGQPTSSLASSWHGTHVAGSVAAVTDNGSGVAGVAFKAKILPVRVLGKCGGYTSDIADGILWAAGLAVSGVPANPNPAKVINMSLGGAASCSATYQSAISKARAAGATVVVAAGNSSADAAKFTPASCPGVVTVAATDRKGARAYYSNFGAPVDLAAPGGDLRYGSGSGILSLLNSGSTAPGGDSYGAYQGTSMAAPHVAGLAALLYGADSSLTPDRAEQILTGTARPFPGTCSGCGAGIADAAAAVAEVTGGGSRDGGVLKNGVTRSGLSGALGSETTFTLEVPAGASNLDFRIGGGSGDADLYVRYGARPTTTSYDYRPMLQGNEESVRVDQPQAGTWHLMIRGSAPYSALSLSGSYIESPPAGASCAPGATGFNGSLAGTGSSRYEPNGNYYYSSARGTHAGRLSGPAGTNFDLVLVRWSGRAWSEVARSSGAGSNESIDYYGSAGYYSWRIESRSGGGYYSFCLSSPK